MIPPPPRSTLFPYTTLFRSITNIPKPVYNDNVSNGSGLPMSYNVFKGDFVKVKNVGIGYNFPAKILSKLKARSEEHTSELQSRLHLVCRLLLEKKKNK